MDPVPPYPATHDFRADVYHETLDVIEAYLNEGIEDLIKPFPEKRGWGHLRRWWSVVFLLPLLVVAVFTILWFSDSVVKIGTLLTPFLSFTQTSIQTTDVGFVNMMWLMKLLQIPVALLGGWLSVGNGKRWRGQTLLLLFVVLSLIFLPPPIPNDPLSPMPEPWIQALVVGLTGWILTAVSYGLGIQAGRFLTLIAEIWYPFRKVVPAIGGRPVPAVTSQAYQFLERRLTDKADVRADLDYISATAQAHLDASDVMSLPWAILIAVFSIEYITNAISPLFKGLLQMGFFVGILIAVLGVFFIAYHASLQVCILQATAQLQRDAAEAHMSPKVSHSMTQRSVLQRFLHWFGRKRKGL